MTERVTGEEIINRKLKKLDVNIAYLESIRPVDLDCIETQYEKRLAVEHALSGFHSSCD